MRAVNGDISVTSRDDCFLPDEKTIHGVMQTTKSCKKTPSDEIVHD